MIPATFRVEWAEQNEYWMIITLRVVFLVFITFFQEWLLMNFCPITTFDRNWTVSTRNTPNALALLRQANSNDPSIPSFYPTTALNWKLLLKANLLVVFKGEYCYFLLKLCLHFNWQFYATKRQVQEWCRFGKILR